MSTKTKSPALRAWVDQYGCWRFAETVRELAAQLGGGRVGRMYIDKCDGGTVHTGYVIGKHWCTEFRVTPVERPA